MSAGKRREATQRRVGRSASPLLAWGLSGALLLLGGCGGENEQATEQRIERERAEATVIAKQEERIKQLQRQQRDARRGSTREPAVTPQSAPGKREPKSSPEGSSGRSDDWPGGSAYTTILASVASEAEARRVQAAASRSGLDAGVLYSTNYRSLKPGFWVVFSGTSPSKQDADRRAARAKSLGYGDAYPRFVSG